MQSLNSIFKTFVTFAPLFLDLFAVLFIIFYFFAALGIHLFGGLLHKNIIPILEQNNISPDVIYLNYNDMIQSFLVSFMMLNMYWGPQVNALKILTGSEYVVIYFIAFYLLLCFFIMAIVVSFIIEYMMYQWRKFTNYLNSTKYEDPRKVEKKIKALYSN
eukprot:TRINITY_DN12739_c0_g1_i2.p1 TRINITY_DN12739_c0_g1~~TRINITY_DN12739_c0_g1_i2.p1  ORF type:complete len:160 (+),score=8.78 TRINITY_DN12739_c0_g1_i2:266-745(+)